ncbi:MAG: helix-turn-helix domain-containing protein [Candidatus Methylacidiphilales bacterium]
MSSLHWSAVRCHLRWYYEHTPHDFTGTFETVNLVAWHLVRGSVSVQFPELLLEAPRGTWMIMTRGIRTQCFSPNAYIQSVHLHVDTGSAEWTGPQAAVIAGSSALTKAASAIALSVPASAGAGRNPPRGLAQPGTMVQHALLQQAVWGFCGQVFPLLLNAGIELRFPSITDPRVVQSMAAIESLPLERSWNRHHVAGIAGISHSQLDRLWNQQLGRSPWQYWDRRRIHHAREKLENTDAPIKEIASELGFVHLTQFSNWFSSRTGFSPRTYRMRTAGTHP